MTQFYLEYAAPTVDDLQQAIANGGFFTGRNAVENYQVFAACSEIWGPMNGVRFVTAGPWLG